MKILIVEDDQELLRTMLKYFDSFGYLCEKAKTKKESETKINQHTYDCIVLDVNLPDGKGTELIESIKAKDSTTGILILSANDSLDDKLIGLDKGADDYLTKPFHLAELNARVKSIVRRNKYNGENVLSFNEIKIKTEQKEARVNDRLIKLTKKEFELLVFLVTNKNKVVTKQSISDHIWGDYIDLYDSYDFIYTHLKNLRKKILENGGNDYINTVYGIGYKFSDGSDE